MDINQFTFYVGVQIAARPLLLPALTYTWQKEATNKTFIIIIVLVFCVTKYFRLTTCSKGKLYILAMGGKQKSRFDGIDVLAMTSYIQGTLLGHKVVNIYDGANSSTVMFKLASTAPKANSADGSTGEAGSKYNKVMLLLESGIRFNVCDSPASSSSDNKTPGAFAMKLRKHIRGTRLEGVKQLGVLDRVVDFRFGSGDRTHHLILELYSSGNIILTDSEYKIVSLLRTHNYQKGDESNKIRVAVHEIYPVTYATTIESDTPSTDETSLLHMDASAWLREQQGDMY